MPRDRPVGVDVWTVLHLLFSDRDGQNLLRPARVADPDWRDQHLSARQPGAGVDHEIANYPRFVIEIEILHLADAAVGRMDGVVLKVLRTS